MGCQSAMPKHLLGKKKKFSLGLGPKAPNPRRIIFFFAQKMLRLSGLAAQATFVFRTFSNLKKRFSTFSSLQLFFLWKGFSDKLLWENSPTNPRRRILPRLLWEKSFPTKLVGEFSDKARRRKPDFSQFLLVVPRALSDWHTLHNPASVLVLCLGHEAPPWEVFWRRMFWNFWLFDRLCFSFLIILWTRLISLAQLKGAQVGILVGFSLGKLWENQAWVIRVSLEGWQW